MYSASVELSILRITISSLSLSRNFLRSPLSVSVAQVKLAAVAEVKAESLVLAEVYSHTIYKTYQDDDFVDVSLFSSSSFCVVFSLVSHLSVSLFFFFSFRCSSSFVIFCVDV